MRNDLLLIDSELNTSTNQNNHQDNTSNNNSTSNNNYKSYLKSFELIIIFIFRFIRLINPFLSLCFIIYNLYYNWSILFIWQLLLIYYWLMFPTSFILIKTRIFTCCVEDNVSIFTTIIFILFGWPFTLLHPIFVIIYWLYDPYRHTTCHFFDSCELKSTDIIFQGANAYYWLGQPFVQLYYFFLLPRTFIIQTLTNDEGIEQKMQIDTKGGTYSDTFAYAPSPPFILAVYAWIFILPINTYNIIVGYKDSTTSSTFDAIAWGLSVFFLVMGICSLFLKRFVATTMYLFTDGENKLVYEVNLK